jgi:hypothetical protein
MMLQLVFIIHLSTHIWFGCYLTMLHLKDYLIGFAMPSVMVLIDTNKNPNIFRLPLLCK